MAAVVVATAATADVAAAVAVAEAIRRLYESEAIKEES